MSKKEKSESKDLVSIPQHDGTLDVSSRSDMENWVARQDLINRVSVFFFWFRFDVFDNDPRTQKVLRSSSKVQFRVDVCEYDENSTNRKKFR